ncbi:MAG: DUF3526 domain-containing protein [Steroidobacteraceae bacterium]|jgi:ABC-2 type transport system permease protein|nr:DUF3526 domain-containing protein [Steroidobacteraceae bacterium]
MSALLLKEWRELARDGRAGIALALLAVTLLFSAWSNHRDAAALVAAERAAAAAEQARWVGQGEKWFHSAAHYGVWAFRPPGSLPAVDPGIRPYVGTAVWMEAHWQNEVMHRPAQDATVIERFGPFSPAILVGVLAPLVIVLLAFGSVASERERGTWTLVLAQGAAPLRVLLAKALVVWLAVAAALVPGLVALAWSTQRLDADLVRFAAWTGLAALHLAMVAAFAVAVSARAASASRALVFCLCAWVFASVLWPRLLVGLASSAEPLPTRAEMRAAYDEFRAAEFARSPRALQHELMRRHGVERVEDLPVNWMAIGFQRSEERGNAFFDRLWGDVFERMRSQQRRVHWGSALSPVVAFGTLSKALAGNDLQHYLAFVAQAEAHRREIQRVLNAGNERRPDVGGQRHLSGPELWSRVDAFRFRAPSLGAALAGVWPALLAALAWSVAALLALLAASRRLR